MHSQQIAVGTTAHSQALDITRRVAAVLAESGLREGWCEVYVPHTTAAVTINEAADPSVMRDILEHLEKAVPWRAGYSHAEGNSAAHIKSVMLGASVRLPVSGGALQLGTWQGIFFMEFDGPRSRKAMVACCPG